jgi:hypothetical protein
MAIVINVVKARYQRADLDRLTLSKGWFDLA